MRKSLKTPNERHADKTPQPLLHIIWKSST